MKIRWMKGNKQDWDILRAWLLLNEPEYLCTMRPRPRRNKRQTITVMDGYLFARVSIALKL